MPDSVTPSPSEVLRRSIPRRRFLCLVAAGGAGLMAAACSQPAAPAATTAKPAATSAAPAATAAAPAATQAPAAPSTDPIKFVCVGDSGAKPLVANDRVVAEINKKLGIKLTVNQGSQWGQDKINVAMATGDLPDLVTGKMPSEYVNQWINDKLVVPLDPHLDAMPTVKKVLQTETPFVAHTDGKFYGFPMKGEYQKVSNVMAYRQDWLENLKLKEPDTLDDLYKMLVAFTKNDPDGNGKNDTVGYSGSGKTYPNLQVLEWAFFANGMPYGDWALDGAGKVVPRFEHPAFKEGLNYLKRLWDEGLMDREFMTLDYSTGLETKFFEGRVGYVNEFAFRHVSRIQNALQKVNPKAKLGYAKPPAGPGGKRGTIGTIRQATSTFVTSGSKAPKKAAAFLEFMASDEGKNFLRLGIEGVHYTKQGGKIVYNEAEREKDAFSANGWAHPLAWGTLYFPFYEGYLPETEPERERALASVQLDCGVNNLFPLMTPIEVEHNSVLSDIYVQSLADMLQNKVGVDQGVTDLGKKWRSQGGDKVLAALNTEYEKKKKP
ncbi:MAG: extracellular solute-binding protein [Chloroflexota bacterium]